MNWHMHFRPSNLIDHTVYIWKYYWMKYIKKSATKQTQLVLSDLFQNMHILYVNYFIFKSFNCQQFAKAHNSSSLHFYTIGKIKNVSG